MTMWLAGDSGSMAAELHFPVEHHLSRVFCVSHQTISVPIAKCEWPYSQAFRQTTRAGTSRRAGADRGKSTASGLRRR